MTCPDDTSVNGVVRDTDDTDDDSGPPWDCDAGYDDEIEEDDGDDEE